MKKISKKFMIVIIAAAIAAASVLVWWQYYGGKGWYQYYVHGTIEPVSFSNTTNTNSLYTDEEFENVISKYELIQNWPVSEGVDPVEQIARDSYVIPGLLSTRTVINRNSHALSICTSMTPQGVAATDKYVLVSAYCHTKTHNSVIYVIDRETHKFIKELVLPDKSHVGSIAVDNHNGNVWVCCYEEKMKCAYVRSFSLKQLEEYQFDDGWNTITYEQSYPLVTLKRASFMYYRYSTQAQEGRLYVGYYRQKADSVSTVNCYEINGDGGIVEAPNQNRKNYDDPAEMPLVTQKISIDGGAQGFATNEDMIAVLTSSGSMNPSYLRIFNHEGEEDIDATVNGGNLAIPQWDLPPMGEEIYIYDNAMYICFESGAFAYRARECDHIDRILVLK